MKTYKFICTTDPYHAHHSEGFNLEGVKTIAEHLTLEEAMCTIAEEAAKIANRDNHTAIESEEQAREWLAEIEDDTTQEARKAWLRNIIDCGEYGVYELDGEIIYRYGDRTFFDDIYRFDVEEEDGNND